MRSPARSTTKSAASSRRPNQLARDILEQHREKLDMTSHILLRRETIERDQLVALLEGETDELEGALVGRFAAATLQAIHCLLRVLPRLAAQAAKLTVGDRRRPDVDVRRAQYGRGRRSRRRICPTDLRNSLPFSSASASSRLRIALMRSRPRPCSRNSSAMRFALTTLSSPTRCGDPPKPSRMPWSIHERPGSRRDEANQRDPTLPSWLGTKSPFLLVRQRVAPGWA
jgi:hypothetical protein